MTIAAPTYALELSGIDKAFPGVKALDQVDFSVASGEVHGLVGENGAGKSTLIKIIAGVYQRDAGQVQVRGQYCDHLTPHAVEDLGIQFIHQELNMVPEFTVAQSVFMGHEVNISKWIPLVANRRMEREAERLIEESLGVKIKGNRLIRDLSVAERQLVQIAKALRADPSIIAFDEPTAPLARREVERLFEVIRILKANGIAVIYISHYLSEITEICDRVTVLRNGKNVGTVESEGLTVDQIVTMMVGHTLDEMYPAREVAMGGPLFELDDATISPAFEGISLTIHHGEVVGMTGLIGSGIDELADAVFGLRSLDSGSMRLEGKRLERMTASKAVSKGLGMVPSDRRGEGVVLTMSVADNLNLASLEKISTRGVIQPRAARSLADQMIESLSIKTPTRETPVRYLSGGNQQKTVMGRWLASDTDVFVLNEPTLGVDVGAKIEIYNLINEITASGAGVLMISSDLPELVGASDRIIVMFRGRIAKELNAHETTSDAVLLWSTGGTDEGAAAMDESTPDGDGRAKATAPREEDRAGE